MSDVKKNKYYKKFRPKNVEPEDYDYDGWFTEQQLDDEEELDDMPPLKDDEEKVKRKKSIKILTTNKLLTRLPI